ncbi:TPA: DUF1799 domain-containing protein [Neisseria bacilliformis]|uniref:DUF1799 domain-containing protein n=1 Tax=Neisseria bacilliformis TaxID=267212 RepID=UPI0028F0F7B1|nr:DUF1799 domain-containing protein [Neisseria bacilliformis]
MCAFGFEAADLAEDAAGVWPCNWPAVCLYCAAATQWRSGALGAYGLDYAALAAVMDMQGIEAADRAELFADVQVIEYEVLQIWSEKNHV